MHEGHFCANRFDHYSIAADVANESVSANNGISGNNTKGYQLLSLLSTICACR